MIGTVSEIDSETKHSHTTTIADETMNERQSKGNKHEMSTFTDLRVQMNSEVVEEYD